MKVCIIGSGAYGLALASITNKNKHETIVWTHSKEETELLNRKRISSKFTEYMIPREIIFTNNFEEAVKSSDLIIIATPAFAFSEITTKLSKCIVKTRQHVLIASKGIEQNTCLFLIEILKNNLDSKQIAVISGPTFAIDIINNSPIGFALGVKCSKTKQVVLNALKNSTTKLRPTKDIIGVELCGAVKNVLAIASGILGGMEVSDSTKALFLTESMNDVKELIKALGGKKKTILSFAGFGDILMTCTSEKSRNYSFGFLIGSGATKEQITEYLNSTTVEGMYTLKSIYLLIRNKKVKIPIINLIYNIILKDVDKERLLKFLIEKE